MIWITRIACQCGCADVAYPVSAYTWIRIQVVLCSDCHRNRSAMSTFGVPLKQKQLKPMLIALDRHSSADCYSLVELIWCNLPPSLPATTVGSWMMLHAAQAAHAFVCTPAWPDQLSGELAKKMGDHCLVQSTTVVHLTIVAIVEDVSFLPEMVQVTLSLTH